MKRILSSAYFYVIVIPASSGAFYMFDSLWITIPALLIGSVSIAHLADGWDRAKRDREYLQEAMGLLDRVSKVMMEQQLKLEAYESKSSKKPKQADKTA